MTFFNDAAASWDDDPAKVRRALEVAEVIRTVAPVTRATRILEYGCGTGLLGLALAPHAAGVTLTDASDGMLEVLGRKLAGGGAANVRALKLDLEHDPLPPERYELVCSLMTLHHIRDLDRVLPLLRKALVPGGTLCVADLDAEDGSFHGPGHSLQHQVHHGFDRVALGARLQAAGFAAPAFRTVHQIEKQVAGATRRFDVFLAVAGTA